MFRLHFSIFSNRVIDNFFSSLCFQLLTTIAIFVKSYSEVLLSVPCGVICSDESHYLANLV